MANKSKDTETEQINDPAGPRRLLRSRRERVLWGVGGGLAEYLNVDPTWVRLGFVAAAFFGGFGVLAYLVMAVVVPEDDGSGRPVSGRRPPTWALVLLGIAILFALPGPFWGWGWEGNHDWWWGFFGIFWIGLLIGAGVLAYRALSGRSRLFGRRRTGGESAEAAGDTDAPGDTDGEAGEPPRLARVLGLIALALIAICCAGALAALSVWATATGSGAAVAGTVIALGVALGATAFFADGERARDSATRNVQPAPWLLALALVLALPAGAVAAADVRFEGGIGERDYSPSTVSEIPDDGYELGIGQLTVDLRDLPWQQGEVVDLKTELGIGQMIVAVPSEVCVVGDADAKAGELLVRGESNAGVDPEFRRGEPTGSAPRLELDAELQLGQVLVTEEDPDEVEDRDEDGDDPEAAAAAREACAR